MYLLSGLKGKVSGVSSLLIFEMLLRAILCGGVWNGFLLGRAKKEDVPCQFCGKKDGDGHLFWDCTFPPLLHFRELPEFSYLMSLDRSRWPRCLLWHGWLPGLSCNGDRAPLAASFGQLACLELESHLGAYPLDSSVFGLMEAGRTFLLSVGLKLLALVSICI